MLSALLLTKHEIISSSFKPLSNGTVIPTPFNTVKYVRAHSYLFFDIIATLLSFSPSSIKAVPK